MTGIGKTHFHPSKVAHTDQQGVNVVPRAGEARAVGRAGFWSHRVDKIELKYLKSAAGKPGSRAEKTIERIEKKLGAKLLKRLDAKPIRLADGQSIASAICFSMLWGSAEKTSGSTRKRNGELTLWTSGRLSIAGTT